MKKRNGFWFCLGWSIYSAVRMFKRTWNNLRSFNAYDGDTIHINAQFELDITV